MKTFRRVLAKTRRSGSSRRCLRGMILGTIGAAVALLSCSSVSALASTTHVYSASFGSPGAAPGELSEPASVAVEEVALGRVGDVYVADMGNNRVQYYNVAGELQGQFTGQDTPAKGFDAPTAVAIDNSTNPLDPSAGDVYVLDSGHDLIDKFEADGSFVDSIATGSGGEPFAELDGAAVDTEGDLWVYQQSGEIDRFSSATTNALLASEASPFGASRGFAVDPEDDLYVNRAAHLIAKINTDEQPLIEELDTQEASAVGVDEQSGEAFVDNKQTIAVFGTAPECTASTPCKTAAGAFIERFGAGHLESGAGVAVNSATGTVYVADAAADELRVFAATTLPGIENEALAGVGVAEATITAEIRAHGTATSYRLEYGTTTAYGSATAEASAGAGLEAVTLRIQLNGLEPGTTYHARLAATNTNGVSHGSDITFTTHPSENGSLPDHRAYELVSAPNNHEVLQPGNTEAGVGETLFSERPLRAAADGDELAYTAEPASTGGSGSQGNGVGDSWLSVRTGSGWSARDVEPPGSELTTRFAAWSSDLSYGIVEALPTNQSDRCDMFFLQSFEGNETTALTPFFVEQPGGCETLYPIDVTASFAGASSDHSHVLFESAEALTPGAVPATNQSGEGEEEEENLYDWSDGRLQLVNILPGSNPVPDPDAAFGGPNGAIGSVNNGPSITNAISQDGTRIFWTDRKTGRIYLRSNDAVTIPVSAGAAEYWTATPEGQYAAYVEGGRAWRFDANRYFESTKPEAEALAEAREALTPEGGGVLAILGMNETGEAGAYTYFVATGVLASNENEFGARSQPGHPNLYVRVGASTKFIATLTAADNFIEGYEKNGGVYLGDWQHAVNERTSEVTPDGAAIGFVSSGQLTAYANRGKREVYLYNGNTGTLVCTSCAPSGLAPQAGATVAVSAGGAGTYQPRWISEDGSRVFFETPEALVPRDRNNTWEVYEWERYGTGTCAEPVGCVYLMSGGAGSERSMLLDASASGDDVFFTSRENLVPSAGTEAVKAYDARVDGGFAEASLSCTGTGCQGVPAAPPTFATPASATFSGTGNYPPGGSVAKPKPQTPSQIRAEHLRLALKACRTKHNRSRRAKCERHARKLYGPTKAAKKARKPTRKTTARGRSAR
jgi:DNA-binding beta-propeller fold protein YncE